MKDMLLISPAVRPRVRDGLYVGFGDLGTSLGEYARERTRDLGALAQNRVELERTWRLLDAIGWSGEDDAQMLQLPNRHGAALLPALDVMLPLLEGWLEELDPADVRKPDRTDELQMVRQFRARAGRVAQMGAND